MRSWVLAVGLSFAVVLVAAERALATEITVTTAADQNGGNLAECSLREAILAVILNANIDGCPAGQAAPTVDIIKFSIGSGVQTITIDNSELDKLLEPVTIDATTQPGYVGTPLIELRRGTAPYGTYALQVMPGASGSTIKGLAISNWSQRTAAAENPGRGIRVDGANNVTIQGNYFGLRADGSEGGGNSTDLTIINGAQNTLVGGSTAATRNVFGGFSAFVNPDSISISGTTTTGTRIQGNYFGVAPDGTTRTNGATITLSSGTSNVIIGGTAPAERNIIGVSIVDFSSTSGAHQIIGNYIGVNANGAALTGSNPTVTVGGVGTVVRGNVATSLSVGGTNAIVQGNIVGLAADGSTVIGGNGLTVSGTGSTVGGTAVAERNVVAGSTGHGLTLAGTNHVVKGNYIGTDTTGQLARPNANGVSLGGTGHQFGGGGRRAERRLGQRGVRRSGHRQRPHHRRQPDRHGG